MTSSETALRDGCADAVRGRPFSAPRKAAGLHVLSPLARRAAILDYWQAIELFAPWPAAPAADDGALPAAARLPWEAGPASPPAGAERRFVAYCGVDALARLPRIVGDALRDEEGAAAAAGGPGYLFSVAVDAAGRALPGSWRLCPRAWVARCCRTVGTARAGWWLGFEIAADALAEDFSHQLAARGDAHRPLAYDDLWEATRRAAIELALPELAERIEIRIVDARGDAGRGLHDFLAASADVRGPVRLDVGAAPPVLFGYLAPDCHPAAAWPERAGRGLRLGEQLAVNAALQTLRDAAGLLPLEIAPGGDGMPVVRDIVAAVLGERASRLARLDRPECAFVGERGEVSLPDAELCGGEMLFAAPDHDGVDALLRALSYADPDGAEEAGGLAEGLDRPDLAPRLLQRMRAADGDWDAAVGRFEEALAREREIRRQRSAMQADFVAFGNLLQEIEATQGQLAANASSTTAAQAELDAALSRYALAAGDLAEAEACRDAHEARRPGWLKMAMTLGGALDRWRLSGCSHAFVREHAARRLADAETHLASRRQALAALAGEAETLGRRLAELDARAACLREARQRARQALPAGHPDSMDWRMPALLLGGPAPWSDAEWTQARGAVFAAAVRLHRLFVAANAGRLERNVRFVAAALADGDARAAADEAFTAAFASLFLVAPVLAVALPAAAALLRRLPQESLGWLLLDGAGRMPAAAAVGAVWRARRTLTLGDVAEQSAVPPLPRFLREAIGRHFQVDADRLDDCDSAHRRAVQASRLGHWREIDGGRIWGGVPLGPAGTEPSSPAGGRGPAACSA